MANIGKLLLLVICVLKVCEGASSSSCYAAGKRFLVPGAWCALTSRASMCTINTFRESYAEMCNADCKYCDKYFHCMANYRTAKNCPNGERDAKIMSDCRDDPSVTDADSMADREANKWGRDGHDCGARYLCAHNCKYDPVAKTCLKSNCP